MLALAPAGRLLEAPDLGHFLELEDLAWFGRALRDFLRDDVLAASSP